MKTIQKPHTPTPRSRRSIARPFSVAAAAFALVLLSVGVVAFTLRNSERDPAVTLVSDPATTLLTGTWERVVVEPGFHVEDVKATSFGLVAAAVEKGVMISEDGGVTWTQAFAGPFEAPTGTATTPAPPLTAPPPSPDVGSWIRRVAEFDGAILAFGGAYDARTGAGEYAVWRSEDTVTWEKTVLSESNLELVDVIVTDERILGIGGDIGAGSVARSEDGREWTIHGPDETGLGSVTLAAAVEYSGGYVGIGEAGTDEAPTLATYRSPDGIAWTLVPGSEFGPDEVDVARALVNLDGTLYGGGFVSTDGETLDATIWRSSDSVTWDRIELDPELSPGYVVDIVPMGGELLVIVQQESRPEARLALFAGNTAGEFHRVADPDGIFDAAAISDWRSTAVENDHIVVVGRQYRQQESGTEPAYVWTWSR